MVEPPAAPATAEAPTSPRRSNGSDPGGVVAAAMAPTRDYDRLVRDGDLLQHAGRTALARERYQQALAVRATGSEALTGLGFVELDQNSVSAAISRFRQALASNPRYSEAYIGLGEAYSHQRSYGQAVQAYQQYLAINPGGSRSEMARRQIESLQERISAARGPETSGADAATSP
ncbi:MAG: tetratricopeptide repeat protein [Deltaproteobacteria bacterium]|nr:tetratricopeptide repeat protein [Deltaproteobacteria bacterium]